jgi:hypothetical protein
LKLNRLNVLYSTRLLTHLTIHVRCPFYVMTVLYFKSLSRRSSNYSSFVWSWTCACAAGTRLPCDYCTFVCPFYRQVCRGDRSVMGRLTLNRTCSTRLRSICRFNVQMHWVQVCKRGNYRTNLLVFVSDSTTRSSAHAAFWVDYGLPMPPPRTGGARHIDVPTAARLTVREPRISLVASIRKSMCLRGLNSGLNLWTRHCQCLFACEPRHDRDWEQEWVSWWLEEATRATLGAFWLDAFDFNWSCFLILLFDCDFKLNDEKINLVWQFTQHHTYSASVCLPTYYSTRYW